MGKKETIAKMKGYKQTKLGRIPMEWEVRKLGDLGGFLKGKGILKEQLSEKGLPCIRYGEIYTIHDFVIKEFHSFISKEVAKESQPIFHNDILFAGSGETLEDIGKAVAYIGKEEAYAGGDVVILRTGKKNHSEYLSYVLNTDTANRQKRKLGQGHSVVHIYASDLADLIVPVPPLREQQKIARILSTWDKAIEKTEQLIAQKQQLKKGLMQQLLTGKVRFKEFKDKWKKVNLRDVAVFENGKAHENCIVDDGRYTVVTSKFISTNGIEYRSSDQNLSPLRKGDITMVMSDVPNGKALAKCFLIHEDDRYTLNQRICSIRPDRINTEFLLYQLNRNKYFMQFDNGVAQTNLRKDEVLDCPIDLPTDSEQKRISKLIGAVNTELDELNKMLINLESQKKGLMQKLLTGEVRVRIN